MIAMIKKFVLFLLRIIRRALCCFSRKRCDSNSQHDAHLEVINVVNDSPNFKKSNIVSFFYFSLTEINFVQLKMERDWNSWDDKPRTIEEHIEVYRENLVKPKEPEVVDEIENIDLFAACVSEKFLLPSDDYLMTCCGFQDMAPKIVKQKKVYLNQGGSQQPSFSRLEATASAEIPITVKLLVFSFS